MSRHKFEGTNYPKVSLWDAICLHALWSNATDVAPYLSKLASPGARERVEQQLLSALKISHEEDVEYIPYINKHYPKYSSNMQHRCFALVNFRHVKRILLKVSRLSSPMAFSMMRPSQSCWVELHGLLLASCGQVVRIAMMSIMNLGIAGFAAN